MKRNRYIVIVGCGRLGSHLANHLSRAGDSVVVIDRDEAALGNLSPGFSGFRIDGDATELAVLKMAKLSQADILMATTHEDNVNLMVAQVARGVFSVPRVLARVLDPKREEVFARLGIETVCPTSIAAEVFLRASATGTAQNKGTRL